MEGMQLKAEFRPENFIAEITGSARFFEGLFKALVIRPYFAMNIVVTHADAHRVSGDDHAFDQDMGVVAEDVTVLERAGLAFIGITHQILCTRKRARHETPLQSRWKARAATTAQRRLFDFGDHVFRFDMVLQDFLQRNVATA